MNDIIKSTSISQHSDLPIFNYGNLVFVAVHINAMNKGEIKKLISYLNTEKVDLLKAEISTYRKIINRIKRIKKYGKNS